MEPVAEVRKELENVKLEVKGSVPNWLSGVLMRNGPVNATIGTESNAHWFDGLAMLHAFSFANGEVRYSNKFLRTDAYNAVFQKKTLNYLGFASDPCRTLFGRFFTALFHLEKHHLHNANINVAKYAGQFVALTEIPLPVRFDPETLETLGVLDYADALPKDSCWESAHPHTDPNTQQAVNYLIHYGRESKYVIYTLKDTARVPFAEIPVAEPSYMHSFSLTDNYIILTQYPLIVKPLNFLLSGKPFIDNFTWHPEKGTEILVIERSSGKVICRAVTDPFFAFHHANAFESEGKVSADIVCYPDASIVMGLGRYYRPAVMAASEDVVYDQKLCRFTIDLATSEVQREKLYHEPMEFPRINGRFDGKHYQYLYLADIRRPEVFADIRPIKKLDLHKRTVHYWREEFCYPGEPVFIEAPDAVHEDDGIVATVVYNLQSKISFLLILEAKEMKEIARAEISQAIPPSLHGQYFNSL